MPIIQLAIIVFVLYCMWRVYEKAGKPGWAAIIPIYNLYVLTQIVKKPGWWVIMYLIPLVNLYFLYISYDKLSRGFGKDEVIYPIGFLLITPIMFAIFAINKNYKFTGIPEDSK